MSHYVDTGKSLVVFGLKHGSSNITQVFKDLNDIDDHAAREKFIQINAETLGGDKYFTLHRKLFNDKIKNNKNLPIFIFIRDPSTAAFSAWIEDLDHWLIKNPFKALIEIPEVLEALKTLKLQYVPIEGINFPFNLKAHHSYLDNKKLSNLVLALDKKVNPFFYGHLLSHHLINVVRLLKRMTYGEYKINTNHIFILDLDDYDPKANELLVEYNIFAKDVIKNPFLDVKNHSTKDIAKRLKPLYEKLSKENFDTNYRLAGEGMCYDHIKEHYKQYFYTPQRFKNFIRELNTNKII